MINRFKRYFIFGLFVVFGFLFNFSFGEYISNVGFNYIPIWNFTNTQTNSKGEYFYNVDSLGNLTTTKDNVDYNFWYFVRGGNPNSYIVMGWKNGQLYVFLTQTNSSNSVTIQYQGYVNGYAVLPDLYQFNTGGNNKNDISFNLSNSDLLSLLGNYGVLGFHANNKNDSSNAGNSSSQYYGNFMFFASNYVSNYCFITNNSDNKYVCFWNSPWISTSSFFENNLTGSLNFSPTSWNSLDSFVGFFDNSPVVNGNSNSSGTLIPIDTDVDKVISYYETRFGWNKSMCYVGTDNLTADYGTSGISFDNGSGESIFGLYYSIYSSYGNNIVKNVGKFINVWLLNYSQWFYNNDNIRWLATDNGPDTNVSYIYTGFTFPFANKPVAIYFMASNLYDGYSTETSQGEDMAFYCYSKLNYQQIKDGDINFEEVKNQVNSGIVGRIEYYNNYQFGNNTGNYQVPNSGIFWNSFGTGYEETDVDLDKTFSDYFTKITDVFQNYSPLYSTGIIPDYILYALIFLLLFRIMKH